MEKYKVFKCSCCESRLSQFKVCRISERHVNEVNELIKKELNDLGAKGRVMFPAIDGLIVGAQYDYADMFEVDRAEEICKTIASAFEVIDQEVMHSNECVLIDLE